MLTRVCSCLGRRSAHLKTKRRRALMIMVLNKDGMAIQKEQDVVPFRNRVKEHAAKIKMSLVNQTKLITAASELVRNMLKYAGGGDTAIEVVSKGMSTGIRLTFVDSGP